MVMDKGVRTEIRERIREGGGRAPPLSVLWRLTVDVKSEFSSSEMRTGTEAEADAEADELDTGRGTGEGKDSAISENCSAAVLSCSFVTAVNSCSARDFMASNSFAVSMAHRFNVYKYNSAVV